MNKNKTSRFLMAFVAAVMLVSTIATEQQAFAHGRTNIPVTLPNGEERAITFVMGHTNEPTYGQEKGIHDGKHSMEIFLRDAATGLDIATANLQADKFFFKSEKSFDKAESIDDADAVERDVQVRGVHGDPGHFHARQVLAEPGIYRYHVTGTINYFGVSDIPVDITAFCRDAPSKFNSQGWLGGFGCTADIDDSNFPTKGHKNHDD